MYMLLVLQRVALMEVNKFIKRLASSLARFLL